MSSMVSISGLASGIAWHDLVDQIIAAEGARRVTPLSQQITANQRRIEAWTSFKNLAARMETAARALSNGGAFGSFVSSGGVSPLSGRALVTASATSAAVPGTYAVEVQQLARAEKLASHGIGSTTTSMSELDAGFTGGSFTINGREVTVAADDTLAQIRDKVNAANTGANPSGVTASILTVGPDDHRLILTATNTGAAGIRIADGDPGVLTQLGVSETSRSVPVNDSGSPLASVLGLTSPPAVRTIVIDGREITVNLATDSLQSLLQKIKASANDAGVDPEAAARLVSDGEGTHLEVRGTVVARADDAESRAILAALGFTRDGLAAAGTNAALRIDGFEVSRGANTISDALAGVTLLLEGAEPGTTVEVSIAPDHDATVNAIKEFAAAYNELVRFTSSQRGEDKPLASNSTLRTAMSRFTNVLLTPISGLDTAFERGAQIGLSLSRTGQLEVDEAKLRSALATQPTDVQSLFAGQTGADPIQGLASRMLDAAASVTRTGDGTVAIQLASLDRSNNTLIRRMDDAETRLELRRESLTFQFTRMEAALSSLQAQGDWLAAQLDAMKPRR